MVTLVRLSSERDPLRNITLLSELLGGLDPIGEAKTIGNVTEHVTYCPVPDHGGDGDQNPSLAVREQPANHQHPILIHCRGGCAHERIMEVLRARMDDPSFSAETDEEADTQYEEAWRTGQQADSDPTAQTVTLPADNMRYLHRASDAGSSTNGHQPPPGDGTADAAALAALEKALEWWGPRCGVSPEDCHADPHMQYTAYVDSRGLWLGFVVQGAPGKQDGYVIKYRFASDAPPKDAEGTDNGKENANGKENKKTDRRFWWHNMCPPEPRFIPALPLESTGATTLIIMEGEGDRTLAARAYRDDPDYFVTSLAGGATTEITPADMAEIYARGYRRILLVMDLDSTGQAARQRLVRAIQDASVNSVNLDAIPVDLGVLMPDPLQRGYKDLRDFRRLWTPPGQTYADPALVRAGIERALAQAEAAQDQIIPVYEEAYAARTPEKPWVIQDIIAPGVVTFISSKPGLGKTTMLLAYFAAARDGGFWLGRRVEPHRILFVTEEGARSLWDKRERFGPMQHVRLHSLGFPSLPEEWDEQIRIVKMVAQRWDARTVIFDPIFSFFHVDDESSSAQVRPGLNRLRYISEAGMAVVGAFHTAKSGSPFSGTIAIPGTCEVALALGPSPDQDPTHRGLTWERHRLNPDVVHPDRPLTVTMQGIEFIIVESASAGAQTLTLTPEHRVLLWLLHEQPAGLRAGDWEKACHEHDTIMRLAKEHPVDRLFTVKPLAHTTFYRRRTELFAHGFVLYDTAAKVYTLGDRGREVLRAVAAF